MSAPAASSASGSGSVPRTLNVEDLAGESLDGEDRTSAWTAPIQRSWAVIEEDEKTGALKSLEIQRQRERKAKLPQSSGTVVEKGVIRYLCVLLDASHAMEPNDLKPNRRRITSDLIDAFIVDFFAQNPISQLGFIICHDGIAEKVTELSGNPIEQSKRVRTKWESFMAKGGTNGGELSIQNGLEMAKNALAQIPPYGSREILLIAAALSTCDPGDIFATIDECAALNITASCIHLAAEMYVCNELAKRTNGVYRVVLNEDHYRELLMSHIPPLPVQVDKQKIRTRRWIRMGFPEQKKQKLDQ